MSKIRKTGISFLRSSQYALWIRPMARNVEAAVSLNEITFHHWNDIMKNNKIITLSSSDFLIYTSHTINDLLLCRKGQCINIYIYFSSITQEPCSEMTI